MEKGEGLLPGKMTGPEQDTRNGWTSIEIIGNTIDAPNYAGIDIEPLLLRPPEDIPLLSDITWRGILIIISTSMVAAGCCSKPRCRVVMTLTEGFSTDAYGRK
jgi:hypothetical protein